MADLCMQCSFDTWGEDGKNFAGKTIEKDTKNGFYTKVFCEGCGLTQVDHTGKCVSKKCVKDGHIYV